MMVKDLTFFFFLLFFSVRNRNAVFSEMEEYRYKYVLPMSIYLYIYTIPVLDSVYTWSLSQGPLALWKMTTFLLPHAKIAHYNSSALPTYRG